jgi:hypothetical protein
MENEYLDWFKELLEKQTYDNIPSYSLLYDFNTCMPKLKAEILKNILYFKESKNDYLNLIKAEIEAIGVNEQADISYIQKWLNRYSLDINDILKLNIQNREFEILFQNEYKYFERHSENRDLSCSIHMDFFEYLKNHFVKALFTFVDENYSSNKKIENTPNEIPKPFKDKTLEAFLNEINNVNDLYKSTFIQCYDFGIKRFTESLISEIKENMLLLPHEKINLYLESQLSESFRIKMPENTLI